MDPYLAVHVILDPWGETLKPPYEGVQGAFVGAVLNFWQTLTSFSAFRVGEVIGVPHVSVSDCCYYYFRPFHDDDVEKWGNPEHLLRVRYNQPFALAWKAVGCPCCKAHWHRRSLGHLDP